MNLQDWLEKWHKPYWMDEDPAGVISNLTPEHVGQLNLMWVIVGRPRIAPGFFDNQLANWELAGRVALQEIDGIQIREYATLFNQAEFYEFICKHRAIFSRYLPMLTWHRLFKAKTKS